MYIKSQASYQSPSYGYLNEIVSIMPLILSSAPQNAARSNQTPLSPSFENPIVYIGYCFYT